MTPIGKKKELYWEHHPSNNVYGNYQGLQCLLGDAHTQCDWTEGHLQQCVQQDALPLLEFCGVQQPKNLSYQVLSINLNSKSTWKLSCLFFCLQDGISKLSPESSLMLKKLLSGRGEIVLGKTRNSMGRLSARFCLIILKFSSERVMSHFHGYKSRNSAQT